MLTSVHKLRHLLIEANCVMFVCLFVCLSAWLKHLVDSVQHNAQITVKYC